MPFHFAINANVVGLAKDVPQGRREAMRNFSQSFKYSYPRQIGPLGREFNNNFYISEASLLGPWPCPWNSEKPRSGVGRNLTGGFFCPLPPWSHNRHLSVLGQSPWGTGPNSTQPQESSRLRQLFAPLINILPYCWSLKSLSYLFIQPIIQQSKAL